MSTVHAPHWLVSQPTCVPVSPSVSRRRPIRSCAASTSRVCLVPLTVTLIARVICYLLIPALTACEGDGPAEGARARELTSWPPPEAPAQKSGGGLVSPPEGVKPDRRARRAPREQP